jgi:4-hydroxy-2-oxoglutarate aldolase
MNLHGIFPPIPTPFSGDTIDARGLAANISRWMRTRLSGVVVLGSNGEAPLLEDAEADAIVATAREGVPRNKVLIAGTGRESTAATIAATKRAAALDADAVLVRTPSYFKNVMTPEVFVRHYTAVADASPVPVLLYNVTMYTGVNLQGDAVARLAEHPNIVGMKESTSDVAQVADLVSKVPESFPVLAGSGATLFASLTVGASGAVLALSAVVPDICVEIYDLVTQRRHEDARALQRQVTPLARLLGSMHGVGGLKYALDQLGYVGGAVRPPLGPLPAEAQEHIRAQLALLGGKLQAAS